MTGAGLTKTQLETLGCALDDLEQDLLNLLSSTEEGAQPVKLKDNQGRLSRMDEMHNQSILLANRNVMKNRLKAVLLARQRLAEGVYGYCDECGETIAFNRLDAYPDAVMCIECQSETEG